MGWLDNQAKKLVSRTLGTWIHEDTFIFVTNNLTFKEREKIVEFSEKFILKVLYFSTFISIMLIMWYVYDKLGAEKLTILLMTLLFIQLVYLNKNISELSNEKK